MFLPAYAIAIGASLKGELAVILALLAADAFTIVVGWRRLVRRGLFREAERPSLEVAREVTGYGLRGQVGAMLSLLNLRLDFLLLAALAGDVTLGVYAVASKFAELLRLPSLALTYVLYPRFSREGRRARVQGARRLIPRAGLFVAAAALPLAIGARFLLPVIYGAAFRSAIVPTYILLVGLAAEGVAGVITAFLYGEARPGLNSLAMGAGVLVTVCLDLLLIPRLHAIGAAWASSAAYLTSTTMLYAIFRRLTRRVDDDDEPLGEAG
jgi:O-antigen/teichoic acid export membrane protein